MKRSLRKKIQRSVSVATTIACLAANTFVCTPNAAAANPNMEISDTISENEEILENNAIDSETEGGSSENANGGSVSDGSSSVVESGFSEDFNVNEKIVPGAEEESRQYGENGSAERGGYWTILVRIQMETLRISPIRLPMEM